MYINIHMYVPPVNICGSDGIDHPNAFLAVRIAS